MQATAEIVKLERQSRTAMLSLDIKQYICDLICESNYCAQGENLRYASYIKQLM